MLVLQQLGFYAALIAVSLVSAVVLLRQYLRGELLGDAPATCFRPRASSRHHAIVARNRGRVTADNRTGAPPRTIERDRCTQRPDPRPHPAIHGIATHGSAVRPLDFIRVLPLGS